MSVHVSPRTAPGTLTIQPFVVPGVLLFSLVLLRAPTLLGGSAYLSLLPFGVALGSLSLHRARWCASTAVPLAVGYVALVVVAAFRGSHFGAITPNAAALQAVQVVLLALLGMFAFLREPRARQRERYLLAPCWAPAVYVVVNVGLHVAGVAAPYSAFRSEGSQLVATTLQSLGFSMNRVQFPLASGVNAFGPICAIAFAISATFAIGGQQRRLAILGALVSLYAILAIDSRGALIFGVLAVVIVTLIPRARHRGLGWVAIALPLLPILLATTLGALSSSMATTLSRTGPGTESITAGTGRTVVWEAAAKRITEPRVENLFGYGQQGQVTSGTSIDYAYIFRGYLDPVAASAHNMVLQTGLDLGWLGILCLVALATVVLVRLARHVDAPLHTGLLTGALTVILIGIVEAAPTPSNTESFIFWILVMFAAMRAFNPDEAAHIRVSSDA